jgi:hypothetical protein
VTWLEVLEDRYGNTSTVLTSYSPESRGMLEALVKTFKRDYVYLGDVDLARSVLALFPLGLPSTTRTTPTVTPICLLRSNFAAPTHPKSRVRFDTGNSKLPPTFSVRPMSRSPEAPPVISFYSSFASDDRLRSVSEVLGEALALRLDNTRSKRCSNASLSKRAAPCNALF